MFVRNRSSFVTALARGNVSESTAVGAVIVRTEHRINKGRLERSEEPLALNSTNPPDVSRIALWLGVSVTAAGEVYGPASAPFTRSAIFTIGSVARRLQVFGDRRWRRTLLGELAASEPQPFERMTLSFARAFGGSIDVPPGLFPGTDLPFPGGRLGYVANPGGVGFHFDQAAAEGSLLPNVELADQLILKWDARPDPGGFSPCRELPALRISPMVAPAKMDTSGRTRAGLAETAELDHEITQAFRALHHAPGYLIFDDLPPGTSLQLEGVGRRSIRFEVPAPPVVVGVYRGRRRDDVSPHIRSIHVNADHETVACAYGYSFQYDQNQAPSWISVEPSTS